MSTFYGGIIMEINIRKEKDALIVSIKGRLDAASSPEFEKEMKTLIADQQS
jgi:anti-anti-sigma regulatory factor